MILVSVGNVQAQRLDTPKQDTVLIGNTTSNPIPTREVDNPAKQPFSASSNAFFPANSNSLIINLSGPPAGKTLVVESITGNALIPTGQNLWSVSINGNFLTVVPQGDVGSGNNAFVFSQQLRLYIPAQGTMTFVFGRNSQMGGGVAGVSVSGYLVDAP